ncbi:MAG: hypothetical protein QF471_07870 [Phycisphaerales bacterium]|nr:hypothetical protein [Phycisphaerales bacterium]
MAESRSGRVEACPVAAPAPGEPALLRPPEIPLGSAASRFSETSLADTVRGDDRFTHGRTLLETSLGPGACSATFIGGDSHPLSRPPESRPTATIVM